MSARRSSLAENARKALAFVAGRVGARPLATLLVVVGVLGAALAERLPERTPLYRGGYRLLAVDFHVHTRFSDGVLSPLEVALTARRHGLDAVSVSEHNLLFPGALAAWSSRVLGGPTVIAGEELTSRDYHVIGVGMRERVAPRRELGEVIDAIHAQGGVVIAAHPVRRFWPALQPVIGKLDAAELMHPLVLFRGARGPQGATEAVDDTATEPAAPDADGAAGDDAKPPRAGWSGWDPGDMRAFFRLARAAGHELSPIGSSDHHFGNMMGVCRTWVFARDDSAEAIVEAVRERRTVVYDERGVAHGDSALVALLADAPPPAYEASIGYAPAAGLDAVTRLAGWAGFVLLLLVAPRRAA